MVMQKKKKKNIKKGYNPPFVKTVSFMIEQGFAGSAKVGDNTESTMGTQQLGNQNDWSVNWRQSAQ